VDEILTNIFLYWLTGSIASSFWYYFLRRQGEEWNNIKSDQLQVPLAANLGPYELHWASSQRVSKIRLFA
jgi:hypothetical protein